jgi:hypothetical protein
MQEWHSLRFADRLLIRKKGTNLVMVISFAKLRIISSISGYQVTGQELS